MKKSSKKAFTLVEVLVVITIIGILAALLLPSVFGASGRKEILDQKNQLKNLSEALEAYRLRDENGRYPEDFTGEGPNGDSVIGGGDADESYLYRLQHFKTKKKNAGVMTYYYYNFLSTTTIEASALSTATTYYLPDDRMSSTGDDKEGKLLDVWDREVSYRKMPTSLPDYRARFDSCSDLLSNKRGMLKRYRKFIGDGKGFHIWSLGPGVGEDNKGEQLYIPIAGAQAPNEGVQNSDYESGGYNSDPDGEPTLNIGNWNLK
jgi:prepilin-type N-terminal cleavage/methylation domain-containing protein